MFKFLITSTVFSESNRHYKPQYYFRKGTFEFFFRNIVCKVDVVCSCRNSLVLFIVN